MARHALISDEPMAWMHVTDVCNRIEERELDEYQASRCWGETLISVIPLYREIVDGV